jgi:hypothetical protein
VAAANAKKLIQLQVRIDVNRSADDTSPFPMRALLLNLLKELQKVTLPMPFSPSMTLPMHLLSQQPLIFPWTMPLPSTLAVFRMLLEKHKKTLRLSVSSSTSAVIIPSVTSPG